jgi:large exoprotein involved in heme utilization and adhesion
VLGSQDLGNQEAGARAVRIRADRLQLGEHTILRGQANLNRALGVRLTGDRIALARSSAIFTSATAGSSGGGDVMIEGDRITIAGSIDAGTVTTGNGGDVTLRARSVTLEDGAFVTSGTLALSAAGAGRAGIVRVEADTVDILGTGLINTSGFGAEEAGSIRVDATTLRILGGDTPVGPQGGLSAEANGATAAGRIDVVADRVEIRNGTIRTAAQNGPAGDIRVAADRIEIRERGNIGSATLGSGRGGGVTLRTGDLVIDGGPGFFAFLTGVNTDSSFFGDGQAGTVDIAAERIAVSNQASITSDTVNGAGGAVRVRADTIDVSAQGQISTSTNGPGAGGRVSITAERLRLRDPRTGVIAQARDVGPAGTLSLAVGHLEVLDGASITTEAAQAAGGAIFVDVDRLTRLNSGAIATSVFSGAGDGGNITLASPVLVLQPGSRISANAERGDGGNIQITTDGLFRFPGTAIEASSRLGIDGRIDIQGPDDSQTVEVVPLSLQFVDATALLKDPCIAALTGRSELVVAGRGGLPLAAASPPGLFLGLMPFPGGANAAPNGTGAGGRADHAGDRALLAAVPCVDAGAER